MSHDTYSIPEGGVCGVGINVGPVPVSDNTVTTTGTKKRAGKDVDWNRVPSPDEDPWIRVAEVVDDINNREYVPTQVLKDALELIRRKHHGDEPTTEQQSTLTLIEDELKGRGEDQSYGETKAVLKKAQIDRSDWEAATVYIEGLPDSEVEDQQYLANLLRENGHQAMSQEVETMSSQEYHDFIVNL